MARPLRIEFPGAIYHVTSRGHGLAPIFTDDADRKALLNVIAQGMTRFNAEVLAYCLMGSHYHFVIHTRQANLSRLMRHINGIYTQAFNRRHGQIGPLFQGRFKAILVDREAHLLDVCLYVESNPLRASVVKSLEKWPWSSYRPHAGLAESPPWLNTAGLHGYIIGREPRNAADRSRAAKRYTSLMAPTPDSRLWDNVLRKQIYLGDEAFVKRMQAQARASRIVEQTAHKARRKNLGLTHWLESSSSREEALYRAHTEGALTMTMIAKKLGLSVSRISRLISHAEGLKRRS